LDLSIVTARQFIEKELEPAAGFKFHYFEDGMHEVLVEEWQCDGRGYFISGTFETYRLCDWLQKISEATQLKVHFDEIVCVAGAICQQLRERHETNQ